MWPLLAPQASQVEEVVDAEPCELQCELLRVKPCRELSRRAHKT